MARSRLIALGCFVVATGAGLTLFRQRGVDEPDLTAADSAFHHSTISASNDCVDDDESADVQRASFETSAHPHGGERAAALRLTHPCAASHVAVQSGRWSDPNTWRDRRLPGAGSRIVIPSDVAVHVDAALDRAAFAWVRVDGRLSFRPDVDTALAVRTIVVTDAGSLTVGSSAAPVGERVRARLLFAPRAGRDRRGDPLDLAGGLIASGVVEMVGPRRDSSMATSTPLQPGTRRIEFTAAPAGWQVGDRLLVPGTVFQSDQDELRTIVRVSDDGRTMALGSSSTTASTSPTGRGATSGCSFRRNAPTAFRFPPAAWKRCVD